MKKIVIIDDNKDVLLSLKILFKNTSYQCTMFDTPSLAMDYLKSNPVDLIIQDMNFDKDTTSGIEGLSLLKEIRTIFPQLPVILFTAWGNIDLAVEGIKNGANNFFTKPWDNKKLLKLVDDTFIISDKRKVHISRSDLNKTYNFQTIIGESPLLLEQLETAGLVANTDAPILIQGENGTGKDVIAQAIHLNSNRKDKPFVKVNIGGISQSLFDSEMFGHVKGAFTGAIDHRKGRFELANGGTLFLDEIGELSAESQVKLLRVLQDGEFEALGSEKTIASDIRIISATNVDLTEAIQSGQFREDLYYRLNTIELHLPALRDRNEDKLLLAREFLSFFEKKYNKKFKGFTSASIDLIMMSKWDGNIREMKHVIERSVLVSQSNELELRMNIQNKNTHNIPEIGSLTLDQVEKEMILKALEQTNYNMTKSAKLLGINRTSLYRRLEKHDINY